MAQIIVICRGLPGSGKTTWARDFCIHNTDYIRIGRDDIRTMRGKYWMPKQEDLITDMEDACIVAALCDGKNVIVDATNFGDRTINRMADISTIIKKEKNIDIKIECEDFTDVPLKQCIENDLKRPNSVGKDVIMKFYDKNLKEPLPKIKHNPDLPDCIIVDIDGTLAHMNGRSPYEWDKVHTDIVDEIVPEIISRFGEMNIILLSGRDSRCRPQTVNWLQDKGILYNDLFMRKMDDTRKDTVIKKEIYEAYIKDRYNVLFILDDRNQVVEMWRSLGLKVLQVADGNF